MSWDYICLVNCELLSKLNNHSLCLHAIDAPYFAFWSLSIIFSNRQNALNKQADINCLLKKLSLPFPICTDLPIIQVSSFVFVLSLEELIYLYDDIIMLN